MNDQKSEMVEIINETDKLRDLARQLLGTEMELHQGEASANELLARHNRLIQAIDRFQEEAIDMFRRANAVRMIKEAKES